MRRRITTDEEKVVNVIAKLIGHLSIARSAPTIIYNRFMIIAEAAKAEKEKKHNGTNNIQN
jgi:hypothetical protein